MKNPPVSGSNLRSIYPFVGIIVFSLFMFYVWLVSVGSWTSFPPGSSYYAWLATAFSHGHLALEVTPAPAVLALPNPYDPAQRKGLEVPGDVSLYGGKYYLYFGPVPGLILAAVKPFYRADIGDLYLVFGFVTGIFIFQYLLLLRIWRQYFQDLPRWTLLIGIALIGLETPITSMLASPYIHEASIAGAQFFFIGGLYFALGVLRERSAPIRSLTLAGIFWAASIGTRSTQLLPVGFMIIMLIWWKTWRPQSAETSSLPRPAFLGLLTPIALGMAGLLWYNRARFGSILEFGLRYQLTWNDIHDPSQILFSPIYILQNLFNYVLSPFRIARLFPFIMYYYGSITSVVSFLNLPAIYHPDKVVGLIYSTPFLVLACVPAIILVRNWFRSKHTPGDPRSLAWISISLVGTTLAPLGMLLFFFWNVERYMADFIPALTLLSLVGFWQGYSLLHQKPAVRKFYALVGGAAAILSMGLSMLLAISMGLDRFRLFNPDLIHWLRNVLGG